MTPIVPTQFEVEPSAAETTSNEMPASPKLWSTRATRNGLALPSLPEAHRTIPFISGASRLRKLLAFAGPGYLVAVGYMDPGNWATDIAGGSKFGYSLLSVILLSNLMAMFLQALSAKLGIATGRDLAQACRENYSKPTAMFLWIVCEIAIAACDLAEVLGSAVALKLLFGLPLLAGVLITGLDVLIVLALQGRGFRLIETFVVTLPSRSGAVLPWDLFPTSKFFEIGKCCTLPSAFWAPR
jgi:manganese transport protein